MKDLQQIKDEGVIKDLRPLGAGIIGGICYIRGNWTSVVIFGSGEPYEHVSISMKDKKGKQILPTWEDMCCIKDLFWKKDECVIQIHPPERDYLHGVGGLENVLHLWAPKDGDWQKLMMDQER